MLAVQEVTSAVWNLQFFRRFLDALLKPSFTFYAVKFPAARDPHELLCCLINESEKGCKTNMKCVQFEQQCLGFVQKHHSRIHPSRNYGNASLNQLEKATTKALGQSSHINKPLPSRITTSLFHLFFNPGTRQHNSERHRGTIIFKPIIVNNSFCIRFINGFNF